ncbi:MAG: tetratricopeptide repeat protein [Spirochaetales bacterium]|nr:tetratricopeptide repeat protein [Spirochaetales bacterium]
MPKKIIMKLCVLLLIIMCVVPVFAQEDESVAPDEGAGEEKPAEGKVDPVFPDENKNIIFIEGENAVATNFFKESIKNFGCSGKQTLQLSRATGLQGGAAFYADFLFYVEEPGTFELWYGGTPAGPQGEDLESYSSPFSYIIDDGRAIDVYRRRMVVVEQYTPSYYWNLVGDVSLGRGKHKIRFEVKEKRKYDGRYYFYLDCFFFVRKVGRSRSIGTPVPEVFPKNMDNRSINKPFLAIEEYIKRINRNPNDVRPYIEVSMVYSLLSNYLDALKYLKRAQAIDRDNLDIMLLIAKNTIWDGDVEGGLKYYKELLALDPKRYEVWLEAGKVAAWTGRYREAVEFFRQGLEHYPDDLGLKLNWGITLEWASEVREAEGIYNQVIESAKGDRLKLGELAAEYVVNGYPLRAAAVYENMQTQFPEYLEYYILQQEVYNKTGQQEQAEALNKKIKARFYESEKLNAYLSIQKEKQGMREALLQEYRKELERNPDNLDLRELLAQTLFWNGLTREAVKEYLNILTNHTYREIKLSDARAFSILETLDKLYILYTYFHNIPNVAADKKREVDNQLALVKRSRAQYETVLKDIELSENIIATLKSSLTGDEAQDAKIKESIAEAEANLAKLQKEKQELSGKVVEDQNLIKEKIKEGYAYFERYTEAVSEVDALKTRVGTIEGTEEKENETFEKVKETTTWQWNEAFVVAELRELEAEKLFLAEHILAKLAQSEKRLADAENQIKDDIKNIPTLPAESKYLYVETLIWQGKGKDALAFLDKELGTISEYAAHAGEVKRFLLKYAAVSQYTGSVSDDYEQELANLATKFAGIVSEAQGNKQVVEQTIDQLLELYSQRLVRTFFYNQQNTYLLRNELGKFYLEEENLNAAIRQFEQVLAMDPNDMGAIYQLGLVYRWKGDWSAAMDHFKRVYDNDPAYERTMAFYNDLARQNSPLVQYSSNYIMDTAGVIELESDLDYTAPLSTMWAFRAGYDIDYYTYYKEWSTAAEPFTYNYHDIKLGVSFYYIDWGLRLTPYVGVRILMMDEFYDLMRKSDFSEEAYSPESIFAYLDVPEPYLYLEAALWETGILTASLRGGYERYHETYAYFLENVYELWGELNLTLKFSFIDIPVIKGTKIRLYGKGEMLDDDNIIYEAAGYLDMTFLQLEYPVSLEMTLLGQAWYQDSTDDVAGEGIYYKPQNKYQFFGGLAAALYFPVAEGHIIGITVQVQGGPYSEYAWPGEQMDFLKIEGDLILEYAVDTLRFFLAANYQGTYEESGLLKELSYGQLSIKLGLEARFPGLLTP